jgi:hypothetical protein
MRSFVRYLATSLFCLAAACNGETPAMDMGPDLAPVVYSCETAGGAPNCKEFTNVSASQSMEGLQGVCGAATLNAATCPRTDLLGGCRAQSATYTLTTWFYKGTMFMTQAEVMTFCGTAFTPPN